MSTTLCRLNSPTRGRAGKPPTWFFIESFLMTIPREVPLYHLPYTYTRRAGSLSRTLGKQPSPGTLFFTIIISRHLVYYSESFRARLRTSTTTTTTFLAPPSSPAFSSSCDGAQQSLERPAEAGSGGGGRGGSRPPPLLFFEAGCGGGGGSRWSERGGPSRLGNARETRMHRATNKLFLSGAVVMHMQQPSSRLAK